MILHFHRSRNSCHFSENSRQNNSGPILTVGLLSQPLLFMMRYENFISKISFQEKSCRAKNERSKVINIEMGDSDEIILNGKSEVQDRRRRSKDPEPSKL